MPLYSDVTSDHGVNHLDRESKLQQEAGGIGGKGWGLCQEIHYYNELQTAPRVLDLLYAVLECREVCHQIGVGNRPKKRRVRKTSLFAADVFTYQLQSDRYLLLAAIVGVSVDATGLGPDA